MSLATATSSETVEFKSSSSEDRFLVGNCEDALEYTAPTMDVDTRLV
jgi:hypothetical protein